MKIEEVDLCTYFVLAWISGPESGWEDTAWMGCTEDCYPEERRGFLQENKNMIVAEFGTREEANRHLHVFLQEQTMANHIASQPQQSVVLPSLPPPPVDVPASVAWEHSLLITSATVAYEGLRNGQFASPTARLRAASILSRVASESAKLRKEGERLGAHQAKPVN